MSTSPWVSPRSAYAGILGLLFGGNFACLFETPFLEFAACGQSNDCDPAWGESRRALGCLLRLDSSGIASSEGGYCVRTGCVDDEGCGKVEGIAQLVCREAHVEAADAKLKVCMIACKDEGCPERMRCVGDGEDSICVPALKCEDGSCDE